MPVGGGGFPIGVSDGSFLLAASPLRPASEAVFQGGDPRSFLRTLCFVLEMGQGAGLNPYFQCMFSNFFSRVGKMVMWL